MGKCRQLFIRSRQNLNANSDFAVVIHCHLLRKWLFHNSFPGGGVLNLAPLVPDKPVQIHNKVHGEEKTSIGFGKSKNVGVKLLFY